MKQVLISAIRLYWLLIPEKRRRSCLFKESCSRYVFRHAVEQGFYSGIKALKSRMRKCRNGYQLYHNGISFEIKLADGTTIGEDEISPPILNPLHEKIQKVTEQYQDLS
jgi:hypothetical protein